MNNKCHRNECKFEKHTNINNNGGTHCCNSCKVKGHHGTFCEKKEYKFLNQINELTNNINLLVVVLSCKKNSHLWPTILNRGIDNLVILCGGAEENKLEGSILYLKCSDEYDGLSEKMTQAYSYIFHSEKFSLITHVLKADDHDTEFNNDDIENITKKHGKILLLHDFIGQKKWNNHGRTYHFGKVPSTSKWYNKAYTGPITPLLDGGATYILSKKALSLISSNNKEYDKYGMSEDFMVAMILKKYNIKPYEFNYGIKHWRG